MNQELMEIQFNQHTCWKKNSITPLIHYIYLEKLFKFFFQQRNILKFSRIGLKNMEKHMGMKKFEIFTFLCLNFDINN